MDRIYYYERQCVSIYGMGSPPDRSLCGFRVVARCSNFIPSFYNRFYDYGVEFRTASQGILDRKKRPVIVEDNGMEAYK